MPSFIVSTSYEQYVKSVCKVVDFPFENTYCTRVNIDEYDISEDEKRRIRKLRDEIVRMPMIEIPKGAKSLKDFSKRDQKTIERLDEIFFEEIPQMESGRMLEEVNPVGGYEKAEAVKDIVERMNVDFQNVIYMGDSITDVNSFRLVRENGGMAVSFNGNEYAIREAMIAVLSKDTFPILTIAHAFKRKGSDGVFEYVQKWDEMFHDSELCPRVVPKIEILTKENREKLAAESSAFRKTVRGEAIGRLG
jgi:energy-converting hydrogenase A subunit R